MPRLTRIKIDSWGSLNVNSPKAMLKPEELAWLQNFITRRGGSLALRPGYARMAGGEPVLLQVASDDFNRASLGANLGLVVSVLVVAGYLHRLVSGRQQRVVAQRVFERERPWLFRPLETAVNGDVTRLVGRSLAPTGR